MGILLWLHRKSFRIVYKPSKKWHRKNPGIFHRLYLWMSAQNRCRCRTMYEMYYVFAIVWASHAVQQGSGGRKSSGYVILTIDPKQKGKKRVYISSFLPDGLRPSHQICPYLRLPSMWSFAHWDLEPEVEWGKWGVHTGAPDFKFSGFFRLYSNFSMLDLIRFYRRYHGFLSLGTYE